MYSEKDIVEKLAQLREMSSENEVVEFKEAKKNYDFKKLGKYVSALSNEANLRNCKESWLVFGIKDEDHSVVDCQFRPDDSDLMSLKKEIADKTNGRFTFNEIYTTEVDGKRVIMFSIPPAPQGIPTNFEGHYYARDHESLQPLGITKIETIRKQATKYDWTAQVVEGATIDDLDPAAISFAKKQYLEKFPAKIPEAEKWDDMKFLDKAKITINGQITRTAIILLGKEESEHYINPCDCKIRWKLLDDKGDSLGYDIIPIPMILGVNRLFEKIRILKYRYIPYGSLFPDEVDNYDRYSIREALNNCLAHQDYEVGSRVNVIERPDSLTFTNKGTFLPESVQKVVEKDIPEETYRNPHLVSAMFNLNMVDTEGGGIRRMFNIQAKRFFPLPEYDIADGRVSVSLIGKVLDEDYASILARNQDLSLIDIILLDKLQKNKEYELNEIQIKYLRKKGLVEGRKGKLHISKAVAQKTGQKGKYSNLSGFDKSYYKDLIVKALSEHKSMTRTEIDDMILDKLPESLKDAQRTNMVMNLIQELRREGKITNTGSRSRSKWVLS